MFSLVVLILCVIYYSIRLSSEKISSKSIDARIELNRKILEGSIEKYGANRDYINDIELQYIHRNKSLFDEAHEVFDTIPSLKGIRMYDGYKYYVPESYNMQTIKSIQMAKRGQIDSIVSRGPVFYGVTTDEGKLLPFTTEQKRDLGKWAQAQIQKVHPECNLLWTPGNNGGDIQIESLAFSHDKKEYV